MELDELHERISKTEGRVLRSLFENGLSGRNCQFIWGIRYCEYLYKKNDEGALKEILKMSYNLYEGNIKASEFNEEIKSNLTEILKEIIQSKDKNVINIASNLIREFTQ